MTETIMDKSTENHEQSDQPDQYHGYGGSYIIDSKTGQRKPYYENEHLLIIPDNTANSIIEQHIDTVEQTTDQMNEVEIDQVVPIELVEQKEFVNIERPIDIVEQLESDTNDETKPAPRKKKSKLGDE